MKFGLLLLTIVLLGIFAIGMLMPVFLGFVNDDVDIEDVQMRSCSQKGDI